MTLKWPFLSHQGRKEFWHQRIIYKKALSHIPPKLIIIFYSPPYRWKITSSRIIPQMSISHQTNLFGAKLSKRHPLQVGEKSFRSPRNDFGCEADVWHVLLHVKWDTNTTQPRQRKCQNDHFDKKRMRNIIKRLWISGVRCQKDNWGLSKCPKKPKMTQNDPNFASVKLHLQNAV